jgi:hypothetical protein
MDSWMKIPNWLVRYEHVDMIPIIVSLISKLLGSSVDSVMLATRASYMAESNVPNACRRITR